MFVSIHTELVFMFGYLLMCRLANFVRSWPTPTIFGRDVSQCQHRALGMSGGPALGTY